MYTRWQRFRKGVTITIKKEYVYKIIKNIGKAFSIQGMNGDCNPFIDSQDELWYIILKMLHSYKITNPSVKQEAPITPAILKAIKK